MKKMKIRLLALAAALALLLPGCAPRGGETPPVPPSSPEEPPALSGSGAEEPAEPVYYDADFYARPEWERGGHRDGDQKRRGPHLGGARQ